MGKSFTRRDFLKISGTTIVGGMAAYSGLSQLQSSTESSGDEREEVIPTFCEVCFWKCGILVYRKGDRITKIEGNPKHPFSNGRLCPRGTAGMGQVTDPDRLKSPLIRIKKDGKQMWKTVGWNEALDYTAKRLQEVKAKYGPGSIALYSHGHGGSFFKHLLKAMGSNVITHPSNDMCRGPRVLGYSLTFGSPVGTPEALDMANSKCIAFLGSHLGENMHNTPVQEISKAAANGAVFITVDPRFSIIASKSEYWLPIRPGTDIALLSAWANVMIDEGIYNKEFVQNNVFGFEQLKNWVKDKTPEWAYIETGIEPQLIRETARELAKNAPHSLVLPGRRVVWYGDDTQRSRMNAIVNALLGNWGKKGGFFIPGSFPLAGIATAPYPKLEGFNHPAQKRYPLAEGVLAEGVCEASFPHPDHKDDPTSIHSWIVYGCNVPLTIPNTEHVYKTMRNLDFVVAIDTMPAEVTAMADVVLPELTYLERYDDLYNPGYHTPFVAIRQPTVKPPRNVDGKPGWWMARELGLRMGLEKYFPFADIEDYLKLRAEKSNISWEQLKKEGVLVKKGHRKYDNSPTMKFPTPSGKVEFVSNKLAAAGLPPLPPYTRPEDAPEGYFRLLSGRSPVHTFTRTTNNRRLLEIQEENELWLNTEMADYMGFKNGEYVMLENQDRVKSGPIRLKVTDRIRQDCVFMAHGFGREDKRLRASYGRGASDSRLFTRVKRDPVMGGSGMFVNFVRMYRA